ncbi:MAG: hypothetical protein Q7W16_07010 [Coriobacteriia bacterium]|nr:hypothetical protein [Coriobacteriia bacterium]
MSAQSVDTPNTPYTCPTCAAPLVEETLKGADWMTLVCPECKTSHRWRGSRMGIGIRVFFIGLWTADWVLMAVDEGWRSDPVRQFLAVAGLAIIAWAIVGLVQMALTSAKWKRSLPQGGAVK